MGEIVLEMPRRKDRRDRFQNPSIGKEYGIWMATKIILKMPCRKDHVQDAQLQRSLPLFPSPSPPFLPSSLPPFLSSSLPVFLSSSLPPFLPSSFPLFLFSFRP